MEGVSSIIYSLGVNYLPVYFQTLSMTLESANAVLNEMTKQTQIGCQKNCQVKEELCDEWVSIGYDGYTVCNLNL
jgi:hypothetical protein